MSNNKAEENRMINIFGEFLEYKNIDQFTQNSLSIIIKSSSIIHIYDMKIISSG